MANKLVTGLISGAALACALWPLSSAAQVQTTPSALAGPYLAARAAGADHDFGAASDWFLQALAQDPRNPVLIDNSLLSLISLGDIDRAGPIASQALSDQIDSQLAHMVVLAQAAQSGDWQTLIATPQNGSAVSTRVDMLTAAWGHLGQGNQEAALRGFDAVRTVPGSSAFAAYHRALALGAMGRWAEAEAFLATPPNQGGVPRTRRTLLAHIQILTELGRNTDALALLDASFGPNMDPAVLALRQAVETGGIVPYDIVQTPTEGIAEVFFTEGGAYIENTPASIVLMYAQIAQNLHSDDAEMIMMTAGLLEELDRFDQAAQTYALVRRDDPAYHSAEFGRADALRQSGAPDAAIDVLQNMLAGYPQLAMAHAELGDILRSQGQMQEAENAYTAALDLVPATDGRHWILRYKRGITAHQLDNWPRAEADFRAALAINPSHAGILNYLGYSLVERGEHLEEAFDMITRAVASEPDNGAITDSLGWAYFTLGRYQEAVVPMERAAQLLPEDPVINDHLGDVYYAVGRRLEAHFQWNRALSFVADDEDLAAAIREKLANGLTLGQDL